MFFITCWNAVIKKSEENLKYLPQRYPPEIYYEEISGIFKHILYRTAHFTEMFFLLTLEDGTALTIRKDQKLSLKRK